MEMERTHKEEGKERYGLSFLTSDECSYLRSILNCHAVGYDLVSLEQLLSFWRNSCPII